jgi:transposase
LRNCSKGIFQNTEVMIHVIHHRRAAGVVEEVMAGYRPVIWVSDLYGIQQGHAEAWQICLAHQLRDCQFAIEAGDAIFAPRMKALLRRAVVIARRRHRLAESTRHHYRQRLELNAVMALMPIQHDRQRLRKLYGRLRSHLITFLDHPEAAADNDAGERLASGCH